jgi:hypothetical protein
MDAKVNKFHEARLKIIEKLQSLEGEKCYDKHGDVGDLGNEIGIAIAPFLVDWEVDDGGNWEEDSFKHGIRHGISLIDGTH